MPALLEPPASRRERARRRGALGRVGTPDGRWAVRAVVEADMMSVPFI